MKLLVNKSTGMVAVRASVALDIYRKDDIFGLNPRDAVILIKKNAATALSKDELDEDAKYEQVDIAVEANGSAIMKTAETAKAPSAPEPKTEPAK